MLARRFTGLSRTSCLFFRFLVGVGVLLSVSFSSTLAVVVLDSSAWSCKLFSSSDEEEKPHMATPGHFDGAMSASLIRLLFLVPVFGRRSSGLARLVLRRFAGCLLLFFSEHCAVSGSCSPVSLIPFGGSTVAPALTVNVVDALSRGGRVSRIPTYTCPQLVHVSSEDPLTYLRYFWPSALHSSQCLFSTWFPE